VISALKDRIDAAWLRRAVRGLIGQARAVWMSGVRSRRILYALTGVECRQKYAGSILGLLWYPLYSLLLLGCYCFIYLVIFKMKYREFSTYEFVLFIFSGLVPYLAFSDAVTSSLPSVRSNLTLLRNSVFPIELVPVKHVLAAFVPLFCSLAILIGMIAPTRHVGWHLLYLPVPLLLLACVSLAAAWSVSAMAVVVPDVAQVVNIALLLFMFVSPIGYSIDMVPPQARLLVYLNPMTFLIEAFRYSLLGIRTLPIWIDAVAVATACLFMTIAAAGFRQFTPALFEYE
jgi:lipopolysaccharide transport system permease protein